MNSEATIAKTGRWTEAADLLRTEPDELLAATKLWILNESRTPPFPMEETVDVKEDARLKYRYVDRVEGEKTEPIVVAPPVAVNVIERAIVFPNQAPRKVDVMVRSEVCVGAAFATWVVPP